jgi:hypothetical protein
VIAPLDPGAKPSSRPHRTSLNIYSFKGLVARPPHQTPGSDFQTVGQTGRVSTRRVCFSTVMNNGQFKVNPSTNVIIFN